MIRQRSIEFSVGIFMIAAIVALIFLALKVSDFGSQGRNDYYVVTASFDNIGSLKVRAPITIAGVKIGEVKKIQLDKKTYQAKVYFAIYDDENHLPTDTSASILTQGLLGSQYISLTPGFDDTFLKTGSQIQNTHSALILENLIGQLVFSLKGGDK